MTSPECSYPLRALVRQSGLTSDAAMKAIGTSGRRWAIVGRTGLTWQTADRWAVRLGLHPFEVWPEMAVNALATEVPACEGCHNDYEPTSRCQRYCSERCRWRTRERARRAARKEVA